MKKLILIFIISFLAPVSLFAEEISEVSLRFSHQDNRIRIVLESDEDSIINANTVTTLSAIKIEFPSQFEFKKDKHFIFETLKNNHFLIINLKDIIDVNVYKLAEPARLVFDLKSEQKDQEEWDQPVEKPDIVKNLVIDAGHGGYDYGIVSKDRKEKDINLILAKDLRTALLKKGKKVFLTRRVDLSASIVERINLSNSKDPDVFISIHSSLTDKFTIYISATEDLNTDVIVRLYSLSSRQNRHIDKSRELSNSIAESIKNELNIDVVQREMPLPILNSMDASAVLIEYPSLKSHSYDKKMRGRIVSSILKGITVYEK